MAQMTIGQLAKHAGIGVETVRYYQRRGLLQTPSAQTASGYGRKVRRYADDEVRTLHFIRAAQAAGFTLRQIGELIELDATSDRARARELAEERIAALDEQIRQLGASRDALHKLAKECADGGPGPCPILSTFER